MNKLLPSAAQVFERLPRYLRRHRLMTSWMQVTREDPVQLVKIRDGAYGYADLQEGMLRLIVIDDGFSDDFFRVGEALLDGGGVFFDVGANLGLLSLGLASKLNEQVDFHLFEPNPGLRQTFEKSRSLYPDMRVVMNPYAVSDHENSLKMHFQEGHLGMSHVVAKGGVNVQSIKLDGYLKDSNIDQVEFMKMDIEGYELTALRGAQLALQNKSIQAIYFEYCEKWLSRYYQPHDLLDYLDSFDYAVCFCCLQDLEAQGGPTHTLRAGLAGHGIPLKPIDRNTLPATTDLLAIPRVHLSSI